MEIDETGFVLRVENYEECVRFYAEILELPIRLQKDGLTNFQFGGSYLMLEKAWETSPPEIQRDAPPYFLRINVENVELASQKVRSKGIEVQYLDFDWGTVGNFRDPSGNLVEFCKWK